MAYHITVLDYVTPVTENMKKFYLLPNSVFVDSILQYYSTQADDGGLNC